MLRWFLFLALTLALPAHATNFGDEAVACAAKSRISLDSPNLGNVFEACDRLVSQKRELDDRAPPEPFPTAGPLVQQCLTKEPSPLRQTCLITTKSFMEGWIQGALMATTLVLVHDPAARDGLSRIPAIGRA